MPPTGSGLQESEPAAQGLVFDPVPQVSQLDLDRSTDELAPIYREVDHWGARGLMCRSHHLIMRDDAFDDVRIGARISERGDAVAVHYEAKRHVTFEETVRGWADVRYKYFIDVQCDRALGGWICRGSYSYNDFIVTGAYSDIGKCAYHLSSPFIPWESQRLDRLWEARLGTADGQMQTVQPEGTSGSWTSWLDCSAYTDRVKRFCKVRGDATDATTTLPRFVGAGADLFDLAAEFGRRAQVSVGVDGLAPDLLLDVQWSDSSPCWRSGFRNDQLRLLVQNAAVGTLRTGVHAGAAATRFRLRTEAGADLWRVDIEPERLVLRTSFRLRDDMPGTDSDGRSPQAIPVECDLRLGQARLAFDAARVATELRDTYEKALGIAAALRAQRMLHHAYLQGAPGAACFIHTFAKILLERAEQSAGHALTYDALPAEKQAEIATLVDTAVDQGLIQVDPANDGWDFFRAHRRDIEARCASAAMPRGDPLPAAFAGTSPRDRRGVRNAEEFAAHRRSFDALRAHAVALSLVSPPGGSTAEVVGRFAEMDNSLQAW